MEDTPDIAPTAVVPCQNLSVFITDILKAFIQSGQTWSIVFVDDGSDPNDQSRLVTRISEFLGIRELSENPSPCP